MIGARRSVVAQRAFEQLGATTDTHYVDSVDGLDGVESDLAGIEAGRWDLGAVSLAADLALWPRVLVLVANPKAWNALDESRPRRVAGGRACVAADGDRHPRERGRRGLRRALPSQRGGARAGDGRRRPSAARGARAGLGPARPGHDARDRAAARTGRARRPPTRRAAHRPATQDHAAEPVDGTWEFESDAADLRAAPGTPADITPENFGHYVFALSRGRWAYTSEAPGACTWGYGTYALRGHRMIWDVTDGGGGGPQNATNRPGEHFEFSWSRFKDTLQVGPLRGAISPNNFIALPWRRVGAEPLRAPFARQCLPPAEGLQF